ncbi:MAG: hypothetical protein NVSMB56_06830 [Pyrinomonadaceae bacterium]
MYDLVILADLLVVSICAFILVRFGRVSHSHPGSIYLFFHLYTFTGRLVALSFGAPPLFTNWGAAFLPVTTEEIIRAAVIADIALMVMTWAWIKAAIDDRKRASRFLNKPKKSPILSFNYIAIISSVAIPVGLISLLAFTYVPIVENLQLSLGEWESSSWVLITQTWIGLSLLVLIYWSGFKWYLVLPMSLYLAIMAVQGYHRFRVILPILLLLQIYLDRRNLRWPSLRIAGILLVLLMLFFPLKNIGHKTRTGSDFNGVVNSSSNIIGDALAGKAADQEFLDQFASALTLIDENGKFYYGSPYLAVLTLPVPRVWWHEKPGLADFMDDFSRPWRPMKEAGMIMTFLGDCYANFGYVGIIVITGLVGYGLARFYFVAYSNDYYSVTRFLYLMVAVNLIQVYRDGLLSIVIFIFVNMMPLVTVVLMNYFLPERTRQP